jgi:hypothetical protein
MAYDPVNGGQLVLFGGNYNGIGYFSDTWYWNGATWAMLSPAASPTSRYAHAMAYDVATNQMVLFGGYEGGSYYNDTWIIGAPTVTAVSPVSGPTTGSSVTITGSGFAEVAATGGVMFGTTAATGYLINSSTSITATSPAEAAGTVDVTVTGSAGTSLKTGADQFTYSNSTWYAAAPTTAPSARYGYAEAYDPATGQTILFGGFTGSSTYYNDTWDWNGANWVQLSPATSPSSREFAAMAYDPAMNGGELLLFGGYNGTSYYNDTWAWNGSTWSQVGNTGDTSCTTTCTNSPSDRDGASMAYDSANGGQLVLFGGYNGAYDNDTWTWNGTTWAQLSPATSPSARYGA